MGVRFSRANIIQDFERRIKTVGPEAMKQVDSDLEFLAEESAQEMQQYISTRGTRYSHEQGRAGRVDTENMLNSVSYRKNPNQSDRVHSWEFGWVENFEKYFTYQEKGFRNWRSGEGVIGMFALRDAATSARDRLVHLGPKIIAKAVKHIEGGF